MTSGQGIRDISLSLSFSHTHTDAHTHLSIPGSPSTCAHPPTPTASRGARCVWGWRASGCRGGGSGEGGWIADTWIPGRRNEQGRAGEDTPGAPEGLQGLGAHPDVSLMLFTQERSGCLPSVLITSLRPWRACEPTGRPSTLEARRPGPDPGGPHVRPFNLSPQPTSLSWGAWPFPGCPRSPPVPGQTQLAGPLPGPRFLEIWVSMAPTSWLVLGTT